MGIKEMFAITAIYLGTGVVAYIVYVIYYIALYIKVAFKDEEKGNLISKRLDYIRELNTYNGNVSNPVLLNICNIIKVIIVWPYGIAGAIALMQKEVFYDIWCYWERAVMPFPF